MLPPARSEEGYHFSSQMKRTEGTAPGTTKTPQQPRCKDGVVAKHLVCVKDFDFVGVGNEMSVFFFHFLESNT